MRTLSIACIVSILAADGIFAVVLLAGGSQDVALAWAGGATLLAAVLVMLGPYHPSIESWPYAFLLAAASVALAVPHHRSWSLVAWSAAAIGTLAIGWAAYRMQPPLAAIAMLVCQTLTIWAPLALIANYQRAAWFSGQDLQWPVLTVAPTLGAIVIALIYLITEARQDRLRHLAGQA